MADKIPMTPAPEISINVAPAEADSDHTSMVHQLIAATAWVPFLTLACIFLHF